MSTTTSKGKMPAYRIQRAIKMLNALKNDDKKASKELTQELLGEMWHTQLNVSQ